jgi:bis(5'-nucleosyl)-tetraphosphatase (symmetrical)
MRRLIIGDIQGCREELERLLEKARFDPAGDRLISVGDIVNRGPDSLGACRLLHRLGARAVRGNHEQHLLRVARSGNMRGGDTFKDVLRAGDRDELLAWIEGLPFVIVEPDLAIVHAGIPPRVTSLTEFGRTINDPAAPDPLQERAFVVSVRYCNAEGHQAARDYPPPGAPFEPWDHFYQGDRKIYFGHWARRGLVMGERVCGLDSGCVYGGSLSAYIPEESRLVQVAARKAYFAKE